MKIIELIEDWKLKIRERRELRKLKSIEKREVKVIKERQQFEHETLRLDREAALEETKARIRKSQKIAQPKPGTVSEKKGGFAAFQDYATNFANNNQSIVGYASQPSRPKTKQQSSGRNALLEPTFKL